MVEYIPGSREIVAVIVDIWKNDPATESLGYGKLLARVKEAKAEAGWVLSEKRMKAALKEFNLQPNKPLFTFVKETKSESVSGVTFPPGVKLQVTKNRGKALFATKNFRAGEKIWAEQPLVQAGSVELLRLMRGGKCCGYCAKSLRLREDGSLLPGGGIACIHCTVNWCSNNCKREDLGHAETHHASLRTFKAHVSSSRWKMYEQFCLEQNWNAGFLYAMVLLHKLKHGEKSEYARAMAGMATIRQDYRQRAVSDPGSLEFEQHEQMWKRGHQLLAEAVKPVYNLSFDEYIEGIGMVNLNNVRGCIFKVHANLNHSCEPNVKVDFFSPSKAEGIAVYASHDIIAGQELTTTYVDPKLGLDARQSQLRINWGFLCTCPRCKREKTLKLTPPVQPGPSVLRNSPTSSPTSENSDEAEPKQRRKSVRFDKNPVTLEVSSS